MQPELFDFLPEENNTEKEFIGKGKIDLTNPHQSNMWEKGRLAAFVGMGFPVHLHREGK